LVADDPADLEKWPLKGERWEWDMTVVADRFLFATGGTAITALVQNVS